ncbi:Putative protein in type-1 retrotransposable element R1DM [Araneus ventricosus]|uniref:Retrovirus-related Pol polyprotein from type-1 retrotransposable element R1 n=1 Tax=Araneus ventricosus TaxID=182803 RepID=A0A4Y2H3X7_ARAVE|nr:Putative protein in type-1 retrotransposable element R1DM [Araneus ventricosus]
MAANTQQHLSNLNSISTNLQTQFQNGLFIVLQINLGRTYPAILKLQNTVKELNPDIILIQEPYVDDNEIKGIPSNWTIFKSQNLKAAIIIPNQTHKAVQILSKPNSVAIKIQMDNNPLTIASAYSSPYSDIQTTLQELSELKASIKEEPILIGADLNGHHEFWGYRNNDTRGNYLLDFVLANGFFILNKPDAPPTYQRNQSMGWPDISLCCNSLALKSPSWEVLDTPSASDHSYILISFQAQNTSQFYRRYKTLHGNHRKFLKSFEKNAQYLEHQIQETTSPEQLDSVALALQQSIIQACNQSYKTKKINYNPGPNWWTTQLETEKKKLRALRRRAQRASSQERTKRFTIESKEKALFKKKIKHARTSGWRKFCTDSTNPYGKHYKAAFRKTVFPTQIAALQNRSKTGNLTDLALSFIDAMFPSSITPTNYATHINNNPNDIPLTYPEVSYVIKNIPAGKAPGLDGIDNLVIKVLHSKKYRFLSKKGKDLSHPSAYRPISLLPALGKVLERLLTQRLTYHLEKAGHISQHQHGFREGRSVDTALNSLLSEIQDARNHSKHTIVLSIDIKGAFDNLHHQAIVQALTNSPCPANLCKIFIDLLQNRKVSIFTPNGPVFKDQQKGCPQGSCSGPVLWNLVANKALQITFKDGIHIQAFADDFVLVIQANTKEELKLKSQEAINKFNIWCEDSKLEVSPEKTQYILISKLVASPRLTWKGKTIKRVNSIKYLGVKVDEKLNWLAHVKEQAVKALKMHQNLTKIAGKNWGISPKHRLHLYKTVVERMLAHGASAWCTDPTTRLSRKLSTIQRPFLLSLSGAYRTTATAALQTILGLPPLPLQLQMEARYVNFTRLKKQVPNCPNIPHPEEIESKAKGWTNHPSNFTLSNQISLEDGGPTSQESINKVKIFTDGSSTEEGVGAAFSVFSNNQEIFHQKIKLKNYNTVFQAEITALKAAILHAIKNHEQEPVTIYIDNKASVYAIANPKSTSTTAREIFNLLFNNPLIKISWIKAHANYPGNERADELAKAAIASGSQLDLPYPASQIKSILRRNMITDWQRLWTSSTTGKKIRELIPKVSQHSAAWNRELIIFMTGHGPFPQNLKRFRLSNTEDCNCGATGTPIHFATSCPFTISWHMTQPSETNELEWKKRIVANKGSRQRITNIIQFMHQNNELFKPLN